MCTWLEEELEGGEEPTGLVGTVGKEGKHSSVQYLCTEQMLPFLVLFFLI